MQTIRAARTFSRGIAVAPAFVAGSGQIAARDYQVTSDAGVEQEIDRFSQAVSQVSAELQELAVQNDIFGGHLSIVGDFTLREGVEGRVRSERQNAELAVQNTIGEFAAMFQAMDDEYMRERSADFIDVGNRLIGALQNRTMDRFAGIREPVIVIAEDLAPSDTAVMDFSLVRGFITAQGGVTSHVSIMARSLGIPALVGVPEILTAVPESGVLIAMDAATGEIVINPDEASQARFAAADLANRRHDSELAERAALPAQTSDGERQVKVYANTGSVEDVRRAAAAGVEGIGLFRSEFLFMDNTHFPTEEEQFAAYREAAETLGREIIIRTLDIGGDKKLSYYEFEPEENPFLGWRAIRMCLSRTDIFRDQLRAILRASAFGKIRIMVPMVISIEEVESTRALLETCKEELRAEGVDFDPEIELGIMVETPAAVFCAEDLARHVDFFSLGTNDLTQYVLAVDRGNKAISDLFNPFHPAVLRAIATVIRAGRAAGIEVGMCGEFASDAQAVPILLGMGLDEFSMAAGEIPRVKEQIRQLTWPGAQALAAEALRCSTAADVQALLGRSAV